MWEKFSKINVKDGYKNCFHANIRRIMLPDVNKSVFNHVYRCRYTILFTSVENFVKSKVKTYFLAYC